MRLFADTYLYSQKLFGTQIFYYIPYSVVSAVGAFRTNTYFTRIKRNVIVYYNNIIYGNIVVVNTFYCYLQLTNYLPQLSQTLF